MAQMRLIQGRRALRSGLAALALLTALVVSALALAPRADAFVYWTTGSGDIARARLNGTGMDPAFIPGAAVYASAIAVYRRHIYWVDGNRDTIGRANLDGTGLNRNFLSMPGLPGTHSPEFSPHDIAVGGGYIYWANWSSFIGRAKLNRTHVDGRFISVRGGSPGYLAVNARHLYWTTMRFEEPNTIGRADLNGTGVRNNFIRSQTSPFNLAVGDGHIYWTTPSRAIVRANLDGTGVRPRFITAGMGQPGGLAVGAGHVYWTGRAYSEPVGGELLGWINRANLDGKAVRWVPAGSDEDSPTDVAVGPGP